MSTLPFPLSADLVAELTSVLDVEGKISRAIEALGPVAGRDVLLLDDEGSALEGALAPLGARITRGVGEAPFRSDLADASVDVVVSPWSGFRGVDAGELAEADRVLRPGGRLLVIHDYGRDDVSRLQPERPELVAWSHRNGPFLKGGFRVRVLHCFWTFDSVAAATTFLERAFGDAGVEVAMALKRPRLSYNVAVFHRTRGGGPPAD